MEILDTLNDLATNLEGRIEEVTILPDDSGFAVLSYPLPKDHWLYGDKSVEDEYGYEETPMVFRMGGNDNIIIDIGKESDSKADPIILSKKEFADKIRQVGRYAIRSATMKGTEQDFDPDAMLQNLVVGFLGYWTEDGLSHRG